MSKPHRSDYRVHERTVTLLPFCRTMRKRSTDAERLLWKHLRDQQVDGIKFRRQHQLGPYILDFYAPSRHLAVEVDGGQHTSVEGARRDGVRSEFLAEHGLSVLRFTNLDVMQNLPGVLERIGQALGMPSP